MTKTITKISVAIVFIAFAFGVFGFLTNTSIFMNSASAATGCSDCGDGGTTGGGGGGGGGGDPTPVTPTCSITINKTEVSAIGESYTVTWNGGPADAVFFINGSAVADSGSATFQFVGPNYERFHMTGNNGGVTCSTEVRIIRTVTVAPVCNSFTASPAVLPAGGGNVTLTWDTTSATNASIDGQSVAGDGTWVINNVTTNRTFTLSLSNSVGSASCQASVTVAQPAPLPTCTLTANPTSIVNGGSSVLSWTTTNASSTSINQGIGAVTGTSLAVSPATTTTYTMTVTNPNGSATCTRVIRVTPVVPTAPRCDNFDAAPLTINRGQSSVLTWTTTNATAAMINNGVGAVAVDGTTTVSPLETTTYTLSLTGANNESASCARTVTVIQPNDNAPRCESFSASATTITRGNSVTLSWDTTNATAVVINPGVGSVSVDGSTSVSPSETTTYTLTVTGTNNQTTSCTRTINVESGSNGGGGGGSSSPKCTLKISDTKISRGDRITLKWDTSRATEVTLKDSHGKTLVTTDGKKSADKKDLYDGEITLRPEKDTTYTLLAERGSKDRTCKVSVDVKDGVTVIEDRDQKPVVTGIALTQVPYTGFEAGPFLTMVFYGLLLLWALYLAYVLVVRRKEGGLAFATATAAPAPVAPQAVEATSIVASTLATPRFVAPAPVAPVATPVVGYGTAETTDAAYEAIANTVEDAAHAARVLISSEAMRHFVAATTDENRTETLTAVLAKAKASYPAEDGWVVLNIDRMKSVTAAIAPVVSVFTPKSVTE
jgi:hypothetical protein